MEKFFENLDKASKALRVADHMVYVTLPLIKEQRLLLKILEEIYNSLLSVVTAILQYEYFNKRVNLSASARDNFEVFKEKCAGRYKISPEQVGKILEVFSLMEKHNSSPFEFVKRGKIVIMSSGMQIASFDIVKVKDYLIVAKDILKKSEDIIIRGKI